MKKLWMIAVALLLLVGCGSKTATDSKDYVKVFNDALNTQQKTEKFDMTLGIKSEVSTDMAMTMDIDIKGQQVDDDATVIPDMMMRMKISMNNQSQDMEMYAHDQNIYLKGTQLPAMMIDQQTFLAAGGLEGSGMDLEAITEAQPKLSIDQDDLKNIEVKDEGSTVSYRFDSTKTDLVDKLLDGLDTMEGVDKSDVKNSVVDIVIKDGAFYQMVMEANLAVQGTEAKVSWTLTMNAVGDAVTMDFPDFSEYKAMQPGA